MTDSQASWPTDELSTLVDRFERPLLAYASRMLNGDWSEAQDAVQETFLRLCREDPEKIRNRVAAWLFFVCRSRVIDMLRTKKPMPIDASVQAMPDLAQTAPEVVSDAEEQTQLLAALDDLTPKQQEVLRLRMQGGLSYREIAEVTGLTVTNVGFHLHAAVKSLHGRLATP
ncbi:sigma-70 family RNA polymerase sigma factor [Rubripirellula amarantea]|uniref:ECF RNA polymerase sigma factor SigL n=1 Tax=Rubripirellula amarantea TaxID=2527999 RepID=A0A5C5WHD6_9BACT|nr:sigma-70 family RNA polymerase sigma factor [Rubripirellula amarantea]MDA8746210.1 sigma-70 family RNA polymerase sigma factor [Rubripirellula amarantea]TWT49413.1 ECF RNA polymerase sigma factor SigL [Rubripirellula amarantea]